MSRPLVSKSQTHVSTDSEDSTLPQHIYFKSDGSTAWVVCSGSTDDEVNEFTV